MPAHVSIFASMQSASQLENAFLSSIVGDLSNNGCDYKILSEATAGSESLAGILRALDDRKRTLQQQLFQLVTNNLQDFVDAYTRGDVLCEQVDSLTSAYATTKEEILGSEYGTVVKLKETLNAYQAAANEAHKNRREMQALKKILGFLEQFDDAQRKLQSLDVSGATIALCGLEEELTKTTNEEAEDSDSKWSKVSAIRVLHDRVPRLKEELIATLQERMAELITYGNDETPYMQITHYLIVQNSHRLTIADVLSCFVRLNILAAQLASIKKSISRHLLKPFTEHHGQLALDVVVENNRSTLRLRKLDDSSDGSDANAVQESAQKRACAIIERIDDMLKFFSDYLFRSELEDRTTTALLFGNMILPDMFEWLINRVINPAVPTSTTEFPKFDLVSNAVRRLETHCLKDYLFSGTESDTREMLSTYVGKLDIHFATKKSEKIIIDGRSLMTRRLYDVEEVEEETYHGSRDGKPVKRRYQVTQTPKLIMLLIVDAVTEACALTETHPVSARKLVQVVFDLLDLYRAIMPSFHRSRYLSDPTSILVFRNDCYYLAKTLVRRLPENNKEIQRFEGFMDQLDDHSQKIAQLGEAAYQAALMQWMRSIQHVLKEKTHGFASIAENRQWQQDCDDAINYIVEKVLAISQAIRPVVTESVVLDLVGRIVDNTLTQIIQDIEDLGDIGADDSHVIARSLNSLVRVIDAFSLPEQEASEATVADLVPSWRKFWLLNGMLEMNLRDIMDSFRRGELQAFEKKELVNLIYALFADTELRSNSIHEIETTDPIPQADDRQFNEDIIPIPESKEDMPSRSSDILVPVDIGDASEDEWGWGDADEDVVGLGEHDS